MIFTNTIITQKSDVKACRDILSKYLSTVPHLTVPSSQKIPSVPEYISNQVNKEQGEGEKLDPSVYLWGVVLLQAPQKH